ncbi:MAG: hypothetical protein NTW73_00745 [Candidatus Parcubacteria bacterium]|nr:hypothetical protein [Candidatus Parcubacteria bacterium]
MEIPKREQITPKVLSPKYSEMYDISGQKEITGHSFDRYVRDKEQDEAIKEQNKKSATAYIREIFNAKGEEQLFLIKLGLSNPNIEVQKASAEMIVFAPIEEVASLIKLGLSNPDIEVQKLSVRAVTMTPKQETASLIMLGLDNPDIEVQKVSAGMIEFALKEERAFLRNIVLEKVRQGLENSDIEVQKVSAGMIFYVPAEERVFLIKQCLENKNIKVQEASGVMIGSVSAEERISLREIVIKKVKEGLKNPDIEIQKASAEMVWFVLEEDRVPLMMLGLENTNIEVQKAFAAIIRFAPENERASLREIVLEKIKQGLENPDIKIQKAAAGMIWFVAEEEKKELFNLIMEKGLGEELVESPIYKNSGVDDKPFITQKFKKTGSETTLIGRFELKGKTILRHIEPNAFLIWQRIYDDYNVWEKAGFDYVPIEPIISYKLNEKGLVDVYSGVLDLNLMDWESKTDIFKDELEEQKKKILDVLTQLKIEHGHTHNNNFCLRFFRDANGKVDFNRAPRLYLIDFDAVISL